MRVRWILALYHITGWRTVFLVAWLAWIDSGIASSAFRAFEWYFGPLSFLAVFNLCVRYHR